jgi:HK97 family phage major capsid protein
MKELEARVDKAEAAAKQAEEDKARIIAAGGVKTMGSSSNSDEQRALRYFGARSVKDLFSVNTGDPKFKAVPEELKHLVRQLKEDLDISRLTQQIFRGEAKDFGDTHAHVNGVLDGNYYAKHVLAPKLKAFGSTVVGAGDEWVPTIVSSQYIEEFELDRNVASQFKQISMPSSPFDIPVQNSVTVARLQAESCDPADNIAAANFGTSKITLNAKKLVEYMCLPEELNEDSAPQILALTRSEVSEAQARAWESAILNGDDSVTHMDADVTASEDARKSWKGLRKLALDNSATKDFGGSALTTSNLRDMRTLMGKFGVNERNLVWVVSSKGYQQMLNLPEVTSVEKFGPMATILRGALAALDGIPIVISEYIRDDLDATGVNTAPSDAFSAVQLVNRTRFMWGVRRPMRVRATMDPTPPGDRWLMASWWRGDFKGLPQSAAETSVTLGINIG